MTIGLNDPCPCGSGKKYKRCHLESDVAEAARTASGSGLQSMEPALADVRALFEGKSPRRSAVDEAQEIMYRAWETPDRDRRIRLAREALAVSPDCADAYVLLAEESAATPEKRKTPLEAGV